MDNKDLANIIENHARIILPDFGAFLLKDSNNNTFKPEYITFSPFLKYNDGILEEYYCKYKGVSKDDSMKQVKAFIENLKEKIKTEGYYTIEGIGQLSRDSKGAIIFNAEGKTTTLKTEKSTSTKQPDEKPIKVTRTKKSTLNESKPITPKEVTIEQNKPKEEEQIFEFDAINTNDIEGINELTVESTPITIDYTSVIEIDESIVESEVESKDVALDQNKIIPEPMAKTKPKAKTKSKLSLLLIYLGISLTLIIVFAFIIRELAFNTDNDTFIISTPEKSIKAESQTNKEESNISTPKDEIDKAYDEISPDENITRSSSDNEKSNVEVQIEKSVIENATIHNQGKEQYYLVVGSFKDKSNAERYSNQLKSEGYNSSVLAQPNGNNSVTVGVFLSKEKAISEKNRLIKKFPSIWISKK